MRKITLSIVILFLIVFMMPAHGNAGLEDEKIAKTAIETIDKGESLSSAELAALLARLEEINEMDKAELTRSEKRDLRKEVRQIDKTLTINGGGVYLSVGALILVIVLLVILL